MAAIVKSLCPAILLSLAAMTLAGVPCPDDKHLCSLDAQCVYEDDKTFRCECNSGYRGDGYLCTDINECTEKVDSCDNNADCLNRNGSFDCLCRSGFTGDGISCRDINECLSMPCNGNATCSNLLGSFRCDCKPGFAGDGYTCDCAPGFIPQGGTCLDVDECMSNPCHVDAVCTNTPGNHSCTCRENFAGDGVTDCHCASGFLLQGTECIDMDECAGNPCDKNAACTNALGSYVCTCNINYTGSGLTCEVFDSCNLCSAQEKCVVVGSSKSCVCLSGYTRDATSQLCVDINECKDMDAHNIRCSRNGSCINSAGSYSCTCNAGHTGDGYDCLSFQFINNAAVG